MSDDVTRMEAVVESAIESHQEIMTFLIELSTKVKGEVYDEHDLVDLGYLSRELERWADEARKEAKARRELIGRVIAIAAARKAVADPDAGAKTFRGRLALAIPDVKRAATVPRPGEQGYQALCSWFGIPKAAAETGAIRFHYNTLSEILSDLTRQGQEAPDGIVKIHDVFATTFRAHAHAKTRKRGDADGG